MARLQAGETVAFKKAAVVVVLSIALFGHIDTVTHTG
jgi:hypothetical protein